MQNKKTLNTKKSPQKGERKTSKSSKKSDNDGLFKFRRYKKVEGSKKKKFKHPKLIVEKHNETVTFMGLTESAKRGHHKNIELEKNPQKGNLKKAYLRDELRHDNLANFGEILKDYNLSDKDRKKVIAYIKKLKEKGTAHRR